MSPRRAPWLSFDLGCPWASCFALFVAGIFQPFGLFILDRWVWRRPSQLTVYLVGALCFEGFVVLIDVAVQFALPALGII